MKLVVENEALAVATVATAISNGATDVQWRRDQAKEILSKQAAKITTKAKEHKRFISKVTQLLGVLGFGTFCYLLGASKLLQH